MTTNNQGQPAGRLQPTNKEWCISEFQPLRTIMAPPGSEGLIWISNQLAVVFEGGALPYRERWNSIEDRV
ncbi:MAG: hypothetical protein LR015_00640 [Verrucomicrobia bacterium]|nr:hypothetical protein [Verrucomicrobiota bacterium]